MTLNKLCEKLEALRATHGRCRVSVAKTSFTDNRENDDVTIMPVCGVDLRYVLDADDDGGTAINADGTERGRHTVILFGDNYDLCEPGAKK